MLSQLLLTLLPKERFQHAEYLNKYVTRHACHCVLSHHYPHTHTNPHSHATVHTSTHNTSGHFAVEDNQTPTQHCHTSITRCSSVKQ